MRTFRHHFILAALVLWLGACGHEPNDLWGSIGESFSLEFDRVDILKQDTALRIEYVDEVHGGENKVCKLVINTAHVELKANSKLGNEAFEEGVISVERVAATGGDFPPIEGGDVTFEEYEFREGGRIKGEFAVVFESGRDLLGNFDNQVKIVSTD